eukprot:jgi/Ulvmu1/3418/UM016_0037.1
MLKCVALVAAFAVSTDVALSQFTIDDLLGGGGGGFGGFSGGGGSFGGPPLAPVPPPPTDGGGSSGGLQSFSASASISGGITGTGDSDAGATNTAAPGGVDLVVQTLQPTHLLYRACPCVDASAPAATDIRGISDAWVAGGTATNAYSMSNMVWSFGQFVDHDLTLTIEDEGGPVFPVGSSDDDMALHRAISVPSSDCPLALNVHSPQLDAGNIYGPQKSYLDSTLREPGSCYMRSSPGGHLPLTTRADSSGLFHLIAGDVRVAEHAFLTAQHTVWLREHNRLCGIIEVDPDYLSSSADAKFELVKKIITSKYQRVILEEFLPALGISQSDLQSATRKMNRPDVTVEFSIAYRLGHDLIGDSVGSLSIASSFNGEAFFLDHGGSPNAPTVTYKADADTRVTNIMASLASTSANEIDGKLSDALRNLLFGVGELEDLAGRNIFRGRELGIPSYAGLAACYGTSHNPTVEAQTPDAWLGLLREPHTGGPLPPTLRAIIVEQFHRSFFGPGGLFWGRYQSDLGKYLSEVTASSYAKIISDNTGASLSGNVFSN